MILKRIERIAAEHPTHVALQGCRACTYAELVVEAHRIGRLVAAHCGGAACAADEHASRVH